MKNKNKILSREEIRNKLVRLAWQIYENNLGESEIFLVGIKGRGEIICSELSIILNDISSLKINLGVITLNKDQPSLNKISTNFDKINCINKIVILIDDVLNSGKTLMYANASFLNIKLKKLSNLVLVNRTHTRFPVKADYIGFSLATTLQEYISVVLDG
ncbi:MAG: phosphoribosyltransferase family protein, partial [Flavobacteriales bacterium]|nr:phosphoribosyltransferase family protein [Flavobacteriales bacterium]